MKQTHLDRSFFASGDADTQLRRITIAFPFGQRPLVPPNIQRNGRKLLLFIFCMIVLACCEYKSNAYVDNGNWVKFRMEEGEQINIYVFYDGKIWPIEADTLLTLQRFGGKGFFPIKEADIATFEVCKVWRNTQYMSYAKDKNHVYYPIEMDSWDGEDWGALVATKYIVKSADPKLFKYLGFGYAISGNNMYYCGKEIKWDESIIRKIAKSVVPSQKN